MSEHARRLTGLQKQVLSLYRACLRGARSKPPESRPPLLAYARCVGKAGGWGVVCGWGRGGEGEWGGCQPWATNQTSIRI